MLKSRRFKGFVMHRQLPTSSTTSSTNCFIEQTSSSTNVISYPLVTNVRPFNKHNCKTTIPSYSRPHRYASFPNSLHHWILSLAIEFAVNSEFDKRFLKLRQRRHQLKGIHALAQLMSFNLGVFRLAKLVVNIRHALVGLLVMLRLLLLLAAFG